MEFLPEASVLIAVIVLRISAFENQRWVLARKNGMRGSSEAIGLFVDLLLPIGSILWYLFLASFAYDYSILNAVILFLIGFASVMIWSVLMKDNILYQLSVVF